MMLPMLSILLMFNFCKVCMEQGFSRIVSSGMSKNERWLHADLAEIEHEKNRKHRQHHAHGNQKHRSQKQRREAHYKNPEYPHGYMHHGLMSTAEEKFSKSEAKSKKTEKE